MHTIQRVKIGFIAVFLLSLIGNGILLAAPLVQDNIWNITTPADGAIVSGEVTIEGSASHANFSAYGVLYAPGPRPTGDSQWSPIVFGVQNMVVNGPLATWDTTGLDNGQYTLALAVYEVGNDTPNLHFVNNITVQNEEATPTPTPTESPTVDPNAPQEPTADAPIGVPTIEQPPTATPRATPTLGPAVEATDENDDTGGSEAEDLLTSIFSGEALKDAFWSGVWIAILLYVFGGLYLAGRAALRYYLKQQSRSHRAP